MTVQQLLNKIEEENIRLDAEIILTGTNDIEDIIGTCVWNGIELHLVSDSSNQNKLLKGGE